MTKKNELRGTINVGATVHRLESGDRDLTLTVTDVEGAYTIPYIQSSASLKVEAGFEDARVAYFRLELAAAARRPAARGVTAGRRRNAPHILTAELTRNSPPAVFPDLAKGEYTLMVEARDAAGTILGRERIRRIGIGTVVAALGDSITEGYFSRGFKLRSLDLKAKDFPKDVVSRDGRNFPQFSPTTAKHKPDVNCFESWMTDLNDLLSRSWRRPVFFANEGWGGNTTGDWLERMRSDGNWRARMRLLRPSVWLIHLGVNDERAKEPAGRVAANIEAMIDILVGEYAAAPGRIVLAKPSYDYWPGARELLLRYCARIEEITRRRGLCRGPDFFKAYSTGRLRWYGQDPVHPNESGMRHMARLWHAAIARGVNPP